MSISIGIHPHRGFCHLHQHACVQSLIKQKAHSSRWMRLKTGTEQTVEFIINRRSTKTIKDQWCATQSVEWKVMDPNTDERNLETELDYNKVEAEKTKHEPNTKKHK